MAEEKEYLAASAMVLDLLQRFPVMRDNDHKLVANIWHDELRKQGINAQLCNGLQILKAIAEGKVSPIESITRCRRKLQQEHPQLRGKRWEDRHMNQTKVQKELGY